PARRRGEYSDGRATAANPRVVRAFLKHLAIGLELSELRREHVKQERLAAIGAIVAGLSHCLKNTLNGLRGGLYVVNRAMENNNAERLEQGWKVLTSSVREIERLSLDMLYFSREHQPKLDLADPNAVLSEVVDLLSASAANQGIEVRAELDPTIDKMPLDRLALYRAVLNLASNAVDACVDSEEGGDSIVVRSGATADEVLISVEDNGVGISERTQKRMFEQFFSTKLGRGTGLGLPVVKKILEEQGGSMEVESTVGVGTTFTIHLPRVPREG
ncbi:MAG: GHKL domain-containing protein, partial [Deltaproteobacteria bacterium]|nr:GHKL domain-containing protein [Deltaproteobacteria bacterium]